MENGFYNLVNFKVLFKGKVVEEQNKMNIILKMVVVLDWDVINVECFEWSKCWNCVVEC